MKPRFYLTIDCSANLRIPVLIRCFFEMCFERGKGCRASNQVKVDLIEKCRTATVVLLINGKGDLLKKLALV